MDWFDMRRAGTLRHTLNMSNSDPLLNWLEEAAQDPINLLTPDRRFVDEIAVRRDTNMPQLTALACVCGPHRPKTKCRQARHGRKAGIEATIERQSTARLLTLLEEEWPPVGDDSLR